MVINQIALYIRKTIHKARLRINILTCKHFSLRYACSSKVAFRVFPTVLLICNNNNDKKECSVTVFEG